ncbi:zinc finger CCCH domain-containing protein 3 isoform X1 [Xenopus tropicalis]|uniref:Zinc finger CCCH domain-containing protein 3 n=1 Tax=Xenopus tropicalis TaxID=8364 RepID=A0A803KCY1_XENTR|nr:zinc finger CCCH domain-containing protein 3 isoform X1 [Xenopus tropicalis]|eukprot:XP_017950172.1 PREDICTED: zinc finger CCCH domain-containing protein 3 isoform X1 [Xenopus tropicalis]
METKQAAHYEGYATRDGSDLISSHKNIHGNVPAPPAPASTRWRNPAQPPYRAQGAFRGGHTQRAGGFIGPAQEQPNQGWKNKYSLVNRTVLASTGTADAGNKGGRAATTALSPVCLTATVAQKSQAALSVPATEQSKLTSKGSTNSLPKPKAQTAPSKQTSAKHLAPTATPAQSAQRVGAPTAGGSSVAGKHQKRPPSQTICISSQESVRLHSQAAVPKPANPVPRTASSDSRGATPSNYIYSPPKPAASPPAPAKIPKVRKTKYTWVANSAKTSLAGKKLSPGGKKLNEENDKGQSPAASMAAPKKKVGVAPKSGTVRNRYKWKAESPGPTAKVHSAKKTQEPPVQTTPKASPHLLFKGQGPPTAPKLPLRDSAHSHYKVKSRTKIIRRRSSSSSPTDKKASPLAPVSVRSRYCLRRRSSPRVKSPVVQRRSSPRGLIHITKHKLRRLPPSKQHDPTKAGPPTTAMRSPPSSRVIKTRYRIVKKNVSALHPASPFSPFSPSLSWRSRVLLVHQIRQLSQSSRFPHPQQRWKSRGIRCIGGVMYRVSANKLSKTSSPGPVSKLSPRAGSLDLSSTSPGSLYPSRTTTPSRYIASRAVQRSLAIIRQAKHKKEKKEYCMYYNRFGKCNRGQNCPFIHDPEKVAVCTRFLRGTCKKTDGTCPFSHKVSKDKMPVCSYFLKGICHNNDCPYSHVYVSRKAEICKDFLKGYCPLGAKCKKKHTLQCPDYARDGKCPNGAKCKLQHRQRKKRPENVAQSEWPRPGGRQGQSAGASAIGSTDTASDEDLGRSRMQTLPAFISLNCSLTPTGDTSQGPAKGATTDDSGKRLQIKPRL